MDADAEELERGDRHLGPFGPARTVMTESRREKNGVNWASSMVVV